MDTNERKNSAIYNAMRRYRMADKALENSSKPPLVSDDVVQTADYVFSRINPTGTIGDSGQLLLAKCKSDRSRRYLVKHAYTDCSANEFVYTKLAQSMGIKMPDAVLFQLSEGEKRRYFKTEYIIGLKYLNITVETPTFRQIREQAHNWQDYFRYIAMYHMFLEGDSLETPLASDGFIYRVDTTDAFLLSDGYLSHAGLNVEADGVNIKNTVHKYVREFEYDQLWKYSDFDHVKHQLAEKYGMENIQYFLEPFVLIQEIQDDYIDSFLNTLCYFYPDFIGDYFKCFISALRKESRAYLKSINHGM